MTDDLDPDPLRSQSRTVNDAANTTRGNFYLYKQKSEFVADFPGWTAPAAGVTAITEHDPTTGAPVFTAILQQTTTVPVVINEFISNAAAHELGHYFDSIQSSVTAGNKTLVTILGSVTVNDEVQLTVKGAGLTPLNSETLSYTVHTGDSLSTIASALTTAINANAELIAAHVTATVSSATITITNASGVGVNYSYALTPTTATEQVWLDVQTTLVSSSTLFTDELGSTGGTGDVNRFNLLTNCSTVGSGGVFNLQEDSSGDYICTGATGNGGALSATYSGLVNWAALEKAWSGFYSLPQDDYAENIAVLLGYTDAIFPSDGATNYQSLDHYFTYGTGAFGCIHKIQTTIGSSGVLPTSYPSGCPAN